MEISALRTSQLECLADAGLCDMDNFKSETLLSYGFGLSSLLLGMVGSPGSRTSLSLPFWDGLAPSEM